LNLTKGAAFIGYKRQHKKVNTTDMKKEELKRNEVRECGSSSFEMRTPQRLFEKQ